jgi:hypothetical protein
MRIARAVKPYCLALTYQHRKVLDLLKNRTSKSLRGLILEGIELVAVQYNLVQEAANVHDWPDWD